MNNLKNISRRTFLKTTALGGSAALFPASLFGMNSLGKKINLGCIGVGRMGRGDLIDFLSFDEIQVVAVCDVDSKRRRNAKELVDNHYAQQNKSGQIRGCQEYEDYRDLLSQPDIDAVSIVTPDHWHGIIAVEAAKAGKDIFLEKPFTRTIHEGRILNDAVARYGIVFQLGSQQRSDVKFRFACELVRNGRIGNLKTIRVGLPEDIATVPQKPMVIPESLNYDFWLGPAKLKPYTEQRVHPQNSYDRPGWMRITDYTAGMITNWGAHHIDIARWGMGNLAEGPVEIEGNAVFPDNGIWDVYFKSRVEYTYKSGVKIITAGPEENKQGVLFEGTEGWVFVQRGFIDTFPKSLLSSFIGPSETRLYSSNNHKKNFIECIKSRKPTVATAENGHLSNTACLLGEIAMNVNRKLYWDPNSEVFVNDEEANRMLSAPMRSPWTL